MAFSERRSEILKILSRLKSVSVQILTERLKVSEVTIRKDLSHLEAQGKLLRTHGGAVLSEEPERLRTLNMRVDERVREKCAIARTARGLLREGDTVYIDAGSTCYLLAREVKEMSLRVVTNSLDVMAELAAYSQATLFSLGGSFRTDARSFIGPLAVEGLKNFQIETCFLGSTGFSAEGFFSSQNTIEAQLKRSILQASRRRIVLSDAGKYGITAFSIFAKPEDEDILVTDTGFRDLDRFRSLGIEVILASFEEEL